MGTLKSWLTWSPWVHLFLLFVAQALALLAFKEAKNQAGNLDVHLTVSALGGGALFSWAMVRGSARWTGRRWPRFVPAFFYGLFIYCLSGQSLQGVELPVPGDFFHPLEYASLAIFLGWGWSGVVPAEAPGRLLATVILTGGPYTLLDEWHQSWVPGRCPSLGDFTWDLAGLAAGAFLVILLRRFSPGWRQAGGRTSTGGTDPPA
ncbi:VanZ family protein [Desulfacinum hydrothermale]|uniref:VanZ family protein n=1 Tax=Desulfacinum hydrothermale TaxID=109258 RepID=UPI0009FF7FF5|nr:VanZ family protein [Desulfacinum hydrothermale]